MRPRRRRSRTAAAASSSLTWLSIFSVARTVAGADHRRRLDELNEEKTKAEAELAALETRWKEEMGLVDKIRAIRRQLEAERRWKSRLRRQFGHAPAKRLPPPAKPALQQPPAKPAPSPPPPLTDEQRENSAAN